MSFQLQNSNSIRPSVPRTVAFVLPGRRTLSEHLPAEIIDLPVSLAERSRYLRKAIVVQALNKPSERQIHLPGVDLMGFRFYVEWLRTGHIDFYATSASSSCSGLLLRDCFDLMFAHIAGSLFEEPNFQDYIIDIMSRYLNASQTPDLKVLEEVFLEKGISNTLRQFVIDRMFAVERKMLGMIRGNSSESNGGEKGEDTRSSSSMSPNNYLANKSVPHDMSNTVGSAEWARMVHSHVRSVNLPDLSRYEKPLPVIPPRTPGQSPTPPSSHPSPQTSSIEVSATPHSDISDDTPADLPSTQQLVQECFRRLPLAALAQDRSSEHPQRADRTPIFGLLLECLERLNGRTVEKGSTHTPSDNASTHMTSSGDTTFDFDTPCRPSPKQTNPRLSPTTDSIQIRPERSFDELPLLGYLSRTGLGERPRALNHAHEEAYPIEVPARVVRRLGHHSPKPQDTSSRQHVQSRPQSRCSDQGDHLQAEQPRQRGSSIAERPHHPYAHLGFSTPRPHLVDPQASHEILESPGHRHSYAGPTHNHSYAHLDFSTPRPRHVDAHESQELLSPVSECRESSVNPLQRDDAEWHQRQRYMMSNSFPPVPLSTSSLALHQRQTTPSPSPAPTPQSEHDFTSDSSLESAFGLSSANAAERYQRQRCLLSAALPPLPPAFTSGGVEVRRKPISVYSSSTAAAADVARKPAPLRGLDWVEQQARNPWAGAAGEGVVKRSRKSRVREMLRSGSAFGRGG
ncbi:hypothetical protein CC86DRAFT_413855 [Ophiobolus disseminans]|uniref:Uncharacterized protein n=1 Tax=Ophiobolus disseminans TaxID=1469910 RepID=A0A6A6ZBP0_9PLEO|nr:hypothetical protein CC86DRAFT_413855 [Ophiobolus disseminans]